jgi:hypothetical protein
MGQYYKIVNVKKREYINPHMFNDGLKLMEFGMSARGTLTALAVLLADGNGRGGGDLHSANTIIGSWAGDPIVIAGDYADEGKFLPADKSDITLYDIATDEGKDISHLVLDALMEDRWFREDFIKDWGHADIHNDYYGEQTKIVEKWKAIQNGNTPVPTANHHSVKGSKGDTYEVVELNDGTDIWTCTCPAYTYNKVPGTDCKHIKEVKTKLVTV